MDSSTLKNMFMLGKSKKAKQSFNKTMGENMLKKINERLEMNTKSVRRESEKAHKNREKKSKIFSKNIVQPLRLLSSSSCLSEEKQDKI
jgi:hypothetical protein